MTLVSMLLMMNQARAEPAYVGGLRLVGVLLIVLLVLTIAYVIKRLIK